LAVENAPDAGLRWLLAIRQEMNAAAYERNIEEFYSADFRFHEAPESLFASDPFHA
jgi:DNA-binding GntR family transcriptional regulator